MKSEKFKFQNMSIKLGNKVKDIVSVFMGIATAKCEYMNGCIQYKVAAPMTKDLDAKECWFDEQQLKVVGVGIAVKRKDDGGPVGKMPKAGHP